jgi:hypothetical protein
LEKEKICTLRQARKLAHAQVTTKKQEKKKQKKKKQKKQSKRARSKVLTFSPCSQSRRNSGLREEQKENKKGSPSNQVFSCFFFVFFSFYFLPSSPNAFTKLSSLCSHTRFPIITPTSFTPTV